MKMLNIGCGSTYHSDWVNIDLVSYSAHVIAHDLTKGLPFESNTFDVCYSSHVLEHLRKEEADFFIEEQKRVLKTNGIIRIAVPDLEVICRNYLNYLDEIVAGNPAHIFRYDYSFLELYDQTTRDRGGGDLGILWASGQIDDIDFVIARHGASAERTIKKSESTWNNNLKEIIEKVSSKEGMFKLFRRGTRIFYYGRCLAAKLMVWIILGKRGVTSFNEGLFRNSGQIHRVMYDRYRLERLLSSKGFVDIRVCRADESIIERFNDYQLDIIGSNTRKPDSLFMEAVCT